MKNLKIALGTLAFGVLLVAGCGKSEGLKAVEEMADKVCACKDVECADRAMKESMSKVSKDTKMKKSEEDAVKKATTRAMECAAKLAARPK